MSTQPTRDRVDPNKINTTPLRRPNWLKVSQLKGDIAKELKVLMRKKELHTVCEEAHCPNMGECWGSGTATFLVLGDVCTRNCGFCDIKHGKPGPIDWEEPKRVARAAQQMELKHAVITSVNRDDQPNGGAEIFAEIIKEIRLAQPGCSVEVLIPDFKGSESALQIVMDQKPEILNHNVETVPSLFKSVQPQAKYDNSRLTLVNAKKMNPEGLTKSGIMIGLGETLDEVKATIKDLRDWQVDILTVGQYLQPSRQHLPIAKYYEPEIFEELKIFAENLGFGWVECAPLVRSSYHAAEQVRALNKNFQ